MRHVEGGRWNDPWQWLLMRSGTEWTEIKMEQKNLGVCKTNVD